MATTDSVIINLLIKEQGVVGAINSQKTLAKQTIELTKLIDNLAARYQIDAAQIVRAFETYNAKIGTAGQGKQISPNAIGGYKLNADEIERQKQAQDELNAKQAEEARIAAEALAIRKQVVQQRKEEEELARLNANRALKESEAITQVLTKEEERNQLISQRRDLELNSMRQQELRSKTYAELLGMYKSGTLSSQEMLDVEVLLNAQRVQSVELAQELAAKEDVVFDKKKKQEALEQQFVNFTKNYGAELKQISTLKPYQQVEQLPGFIQKVADASGVTTSEIMNLVRATKMFDGSTIKKVEQSLRDLQNGTTGTIKEMFNLRTIMNTAFGVGMAMLIFQLQMLISKFFTDTIQQAKDLSNALGKISIAEQVMSKEGIEVSGKDMLKIVSDLKKEFTNVSNVDMLKATGDMALRLAGTGFTPEELKGLLEVANAAKIRNPDRTLEDIMGTVSAAAMSGQVEGVRNLGGGLSVAASDVQAYAKKVGMIKNINDKLTEEQKLHARAGVLIEQNNKTLQETLKLQDNLANAGDKLAANWKNLTEQATPLVDYWNAILFVLAYVIEQILYLSTVWDQLIDGTSKFHDELRKTNPIVGFLIWGFTNVVNFVIFIGKELIKAFVPVIAILNKAKSVYEDVTGKKISEQPSETTLSNQDTPTGPVVPKSDDTEENADKLKKALIDLAEAMDQFAQRAQRMEEDFAETMRRLQEDFNIDRNRFLEDWAADRQKILDDSEDEMARKQRDYDNRKRNAEAKLQEDLRQLREKYLMNLDDALHERDARQVLRLAREYAMNKQNLINEFNINQADSAAQHRSEMEDLAHQRDDRLKALDEERALKLKRMEEDFALEKKRKEEEHKLEMERLEQERQDKLRQLAQSLADQLGLNEDGSKAIYELYLSYFGPKGAIPNLMEASYKNVVAYAEKMAKKLQEILKKFKEIADASSFSKSENTQPNSSGTTDTNKGMWRAKGGVDVANKPTLLGFGEAGAEAAFTIPLNQLSTLKGGFGSLFGGAESPKAELLISLSPDLEARIVNKSLNGMSEIVTRIRRDRK